MPKNFKNSTTGRMMGNMQKHVGKTIKVSAVGVKNTFKKSAKNSY